MKSGKMSFLPQGMEVYHCCM